MWKRFQWELLSSWCEAGHHTCTCMKARVFTSTLSLLIHSNSQRAHLCFWFTDNLQCFFKEAKLTTHTHPSSPPRAFLGALSHNSSCPHHKAPSLSSLQSIREKSAEPPPPPLWWMVVFSRDAEPALWTRKHGAACVVVVAFALLRSDRRCAAHTVCWLLSLAETQVVNYVFHAKHTITR